MNLEKLNILKSSDNACQIVGNMFILGQKGPDEWVKVEDDTTEVNKSVEPFFSKTYSKIFSGAMWMLNCEL